MVNWDNKDTMWFEIWIVIIFTSAATAAIILFVLIFKPELLIISIILIGLLVLVIGAAYTIDYHYWMEEKYRSKENA